MKRYIHYLFPLFLFTLHTSATFPSSKNASATTQLKLTITNIQLPKGRIRVAIYNAAGGFLEEKKYYSTQNAAVNQGQGSAVSFEFVLPYGDYAVTTYHDINENRLLDRNTLGIPDEPYAISRTTVKWRKPQFNEAKLTFNQPHYQLNLELKRWSER
jgi:uncharacterized protein (DUF2141 family)